LKLSKKFYFFSILSAWKLALLTPNL
jgi:hypothetical protein